MNSKFTSAVNSTAGYVRGKENAYADKAGGYTTPYDSCPYPDPPHVSYCKGYHARYTILGIFNLIPAFPSDGGRILRAALVKVKDYDKATKDAVKVGVTISYGFMALGFLMMVTGSFLSGIRILLIGWSLNSGAQSYLSSCWILISCTFTYLFYFYLS